MIVAVTGGNGFIGTNLVWRLRRKYVTFSIDVEPPWPVDHSGGRQITYRRCDIRNVGRLAEDLRGVSCVIHLAARTRVLDSIENPQLTFDVNVGGTQDVLQAMRVAGVKHMIFASTAGAIIGDAKVRAYRESMACNPISPYGASKLAGEGLCSAYASAYGMTITRLRFSNVYGPFSHNKQSAIAAYFRAAKQKKPFVLRGDGKNERDYVHVDDVCTAILAAVAKPMSDVIQIGSGIGTSVNDLLGLMQKTVGRPVEVQRGGPALVEGEVRRAVCDVRKAAEVLGWTPQIRLEKGIPALWKFWQRHA